jgi:hypothetical protein
MKGLNTTLVLFVIFSVQSCVKENVLPDLKIYQGDYRLQEYIENKKLKYSFDYENGLLKSHIQVDSPTTITFKYHYENDIGKPDTIYVRESTITGKTNYIFPDQEPPTEITDYKIVLKYDDERISEFVFYQDPYHYFRLVLEFDLNGKIVRQAQVFRKRGLAYIVNFLWEGNNITRYEETYEDGAGGTTIVHEFEYDDKVNPYKVVFKDFKFDFIRMLPLTENNFVNEKIYLKNTPNKIFRYSFTFSYSGHGYPISKMALIHDFDGNRQQFNSSYKYTNLEIPD